MKSPRLLVAAFGLVVLAASACTTHAGAAAQVGDTTIDQATVRGIVDRGMAAYEAYAKKNPDVIAQLEQQRGPVTRESVQTLVLELLVKIKLDEAEASRLTAENHHEVSLTSQEFDAYYQAYTVLNYGSVAAFEEVGAYNGLAPSDLRDVFVRSVALDSEIVDEVAPELVATDEETRTDYDQRLATFGVDSLPLSYEVAKPYLKRFYSTVDSQRQAKLTPLLTAATKREGVSISPRYGQWSEATLSVLSADGSIATTPTPTPELNLQ